MEYVRLLPPKLIIERLQTSKVLDVVRATGLHYNTVYRWRRGQVSDPHYSAWLALSEYFEDP